MVGRSVIRVERDEEVGNSSTAGLGSALVKEQVDARRAVLPINGVAREIGRRFDENGRGNKRADVVVVVVNRAN